MNTKKWTTKQGENVQIKDMDNSHLLNTIWMLDRAHFARMLECVRAQTLLQGEMAIYSMEREERLMAAMGPCYNWPIYEDLYAEAVGRGLIQPLPGERLSALREF